MKLPRDMVGKGTLTPFSLGQISHALYEVGGGIGGICSLYGPRGVTNGR